jgi:hypothetical protein
MPRVLFEPTMPKVYNGDVESSDFVRFKRIAMLHAYEAKLDKQDFPGKKRAETPKIPTLSPMRSCPELKFNHSQGYIMGGKNQSPPRRRELTQWWKKAPTKAGEAANNCQKKLSEVENFTGIYKHRFLDHGVSLGMNYDLPEESLKLLRTTFRSDVNIPARSLDFASEVNWRLSLRPS